MPPLPLLLAVFVHRAHHPERAHNATHWSVQKLAETMDINLSMVHRVWGGNRLKPHLTRTFKLSNDLLFIEKVQDIVRSYFNPPCPRAVAGREEPDLDSGPDAAEFANLPGPMRYDDARLQTTWDAPLFAALEMDEDRLIGECMARHPH